MNLTEKTIETVLQRLRALLNGNTFAIASAHNFDTPGNSLSLMTDCTLQRQWTEREGEAIRLHTYESGHRSISFSAGHYVWVFGIDEGHEFYFRHDEVTIILVAPNRSKHKHVFKLQRKDHER